MKRGAILLAILLLLLPASVAGEGGDYIESFHSHVEINSDGWLDVAETITVVTTGGQFATGLTRLLPTRAGSGELRRRYTIDAVTREGADVEYRLEHTEKGLLLTIGNPDVFLPPGQYTYTISYRTNRFVQANSQREQLIWNIKAQWPVPILKASATVEFPQLADRFSGWDVFLDGAVADSGLYVMERQPTRVDAVLKHPLEAGTCFTVGVSWPAGMVATEYDGERIISTLSHTRLNADTTMTVSEEITVFVGGSQIQRGIYRDFPTIYQHEDGQRHVVDFQLVEVLRNGMPEPHSLERLENGYRIRIGASDVLLEHGIHTYTITYVTDRQLGFFDDHHELSWNVHGTEWSFYTDQVTWVLELPEQIPRQELMIAGFTGQTGEEGVDWLHYIDDEGRLVMATTRQLAPEESFTGVVGWPPGHVQPPGRDAGYWLRDNLDGAVALLAFALLLLWYIPVWIRHGRNPLAGTVIPRFSPPEGYSPAEVRYLSQMGFDHKTFATAIISLAVKGYLTISEADKEFTLIKNDQQSQALSADEQIVADKLLGGRDYLILKNNRHETIKGALIAQRKHLEENLKGSHFHTNRRWVVPPLLLSVLAPLVPGFAYGVEAALAELVTLTVFSLWLVLGCVLLQSLFRWWQSERAFSILLLCLLCCVLFAGLSGGAVYLLPGTVPLPGLMMGIYGAIVLVNILFWHLMYAPTRRGQKVMDQVDGFCMYLMVAEQDRLQMSGPPKPTPELFERYLPYAVALAVEKQWARQFAAVIGGIGPEQQYTPDWYHGSSWRNLGTVGMTTAVSSSLSRTVSAASTPPGSSSGFGGGGSGGGGAGSGGGGGGGGGW